MRLNAARHTKCGFGTKLCHFARHRSEAICRIIIDGVMQAQKPNNVGALANLIKVSSASSSQITTIYPSAWTALDTNFIQKIRFSPAITTTSHSDESLCVCTHN